MSVVTTDRVKRIDIQPYDQVFALTQWIINNGLQTNWLELVQENADLLQPMAFTQPGAGTIFGAVVDYPRIVVETGFTEDLSSVIYMMCFKKGTFKLVNAVLDANGQPIVDAETGEAKTDTISYPLAGWRLAFSLELGMTLHERESNTFKKLGIKAGEYSLNELMVKFDTATFEPTQSYYGADTKTWDQFPQNVKDGLEFVVGKLKHNLLAKMSPASTVGYALKDAQTSNDKKPKLTFTPNQIQYQTYPWIDPQAVNYQPSSGLEGNQRLNYLLYCETTDDRQLPPVDKRVLPRNGNWTDGRLDVESNAESVDFGSFFMSRENFFDRYLLKKLAVLNRAMEPYMTRNYTKTDGVYPVWVFENDLTIGSHDVPDDYYQWKPVNDTTWQFSSSFKPAQSNDESGFHGWWSQVWANGNCDCTNTLTYVPGTDIIRLVGKSHIYLSFHYWERNNIGPNTDETDELEWNIDWSMELDLEAVQDGGLQIKSNFPPIKLTPLKSSLHRLNNFKDYTEKAMNTAIGNAENLRKELAEELAGKQGLVLPAGGVFFFKNPILSHRGDLICSVQYSSVAPSIMFDPNDKTVINDQGGARLELAGGSTTALPPAPESGTILKTSDHKSSDDKAMNEKPTENHS